MHEIISPSDFEEDEKAIISEALPIRNFRKADFLEKIATAEGYLSLAPEITDFQIIFSKSGKLSKDDLIYNCRRKSDQVTLIPDIEDKEEKRSFFCLLLLL